MRHQLGDPKTIAEFGNQSDGHQKVRCSAGNEPPVVDVDLVASNRSFFFPGVPVRYAVRVTDREDGSLQAGSIPARRVNVTAQYLKDGTAAAGTGASKANTNAAGRKLIEGSDCLSCHQFDKKSIGPAYVDVARKYRDDSTATAHLVRKIREGGSGVWGGVNMPAHPTISRQQATAIVGYILSLGDEKANAPGLPDRGACSAWWSLCRSARACPAPWSCPPVGTSLSPAGPGATLRAGRYQPPRWTRTLPTRPSA